MPGYRVLHRDLKPSNLGFTHSGRVVLFDFGLCRLWARDPPGENDEDSLRSLTGMTGSLRYMAPEVALCAPYNHKAEVFSFTSLLFEIIAHQKPFFWYIHMYLCIYLSMSIYIHIYIHRDISIYKPQGGGLLLHLTAL